MDSQPPAPDPFGPFSNLPADDPTADPFGPPPEYEPQPVVDGLSPDADPFAPTEFDRAALTATRRPRGPLMALAGFAVVLVTVGGGALVAHSWLSATSQAAAEAIPASVDMYVGIDLVRLQSGETKDVIDALARAASPGSDAPIDAAIDQLDQMFEDELGVTFTDDIAPWLGRTIGVGIQIPITDDVMATQPDVVVAIEVRDDAKADAFLDALVARDPSEFVELSSDQGRLWADSTGTAKLWHTEGMLVVGTAALMDYAMVMVPSSSLAADPTFQTLTSQLPPSRTATVFVDGSPALWGTHQLPEEVVPTSKSAMSLDLTSAGLVVDTVTSGSDTFDTFRPGIDPDVLPMLDTHTLAFLQLGSLSDIYDSVKPAFETAALGDRGSLDGELEDAFGFDVVTSVIHHLDGPSVLALTRREPGAIPGADVPLGFVAAFGTTEPEKVDVGVDHLAHTAQDEGMNVTRTGDLYQDEDTGLVFGVAGPWLAFGDRDDVAMLTTQPSARLIDSLQYRDTVAHLPDGQRVQAYVDIRSLVDEFVTDPSMRRALAPYQSLAVGSSVDGTYSHATMFLAIDTNSTLSLDVPGHAAGVEAAAPSTH
jgi:hypothetical protein